MIMRLLFVNPPPPRQGAGARDNRLHVGQILEYVLKATEVNAFSCQKFTKVSAIVNSYSKFRVFRQTRRLGLSGAELYIPKEDCSTQWPAEARKCSGLPRRFLGPGLGGESISTSSKRVKPLCYILQPLFTCHAREFRIHDSRVMVFAYDGRLQHFYSVGNRLARHGVAGLLQIGPAEAHSPQSEGVKGDAIHQQSVQQWW